MFPVEEIKRYTGILKTSADVFYLGVVVGIPLFIIFDVSALTFSLISLVLFIKISTAGWAMRIKKYLGNKGDDKKTERLNHPEEEVTL